MCRLCAFTDTNASPFIRLLAMDRALLMAQGDLPAQRDGWGISDGVITKKAKGAYRSYNQTAWMQDFERTNNSDKIWISHVRQASTGTALTDDEAHPFVFPNFVAAHNGTIYGTLVDDTPKDSPNSDSWRAFWRLNELIKDGASIDSVLETWLNRYEDSSAFVFFILQNEKLHIIRGPKTRDMYYAPMGNGLMLHTDTVVIQATQAQLQWINQEPIQEVKEFPELHYAVISPGKSEFDHLRAIKWEPKRAYAQTYLRYDNTTLIPYNRTAADRQKDGVWIRVSRKDSDAADSELQAAWIKIRQKLQPMREALALEYAAMINRKLVPTFKPAVLSYEAFTLYELEHILEQLQTDAFGLTAKHREYIDVWNKIVDEDKESIALEWIGINESGAPFWKFSNVEDFLGDLKK